MIASFANLFLTRIGTLCRSLVMVQRFLRMSLPFMHRGQVEMRDSDQVARGLSAI